MTDNHTLVKENWSLFRAGKITLAELLSRNNKACLSSEVKVVKVSTPSSVQAAQKIFGSPAEEGWENG
jgi:hypothetical protein